MLCRIYDANQLFLQPSNHLLLFRGGMDVGSGMVFAANTVDGLIHQAGMCRVCAVLIYLAS